MDQSRPSKITDFSNTFKCQDNIFGFDIPMSNGPIMKVNNSLNGISEIIDDFF